MPDTKETAFHSTCFACGTGNNHGLHIKFKDEPNGSTGSVSIPSHFQSYEGVVHGGIVATMLDAAMVHALREQHGESPLTCRLEVRYLQAVPPGKRITIKARKIGKRRNIVLAHAELQCENICLASARGAFIISKQQAKHSNSFP
jgi:uncharacterized protein (TIGR00369 family)